MLYPIENEIRQVKCLNGIWRFQRETRYGQGFEERWYEKPLETAIEMPVPASYNDITVDPALRDHTGWVWYERIFSIPADWMEKRMVLRFGSVTHHAIVYVNGKAVTTHKGGFLPFEAELNGSVVPGKNRLTVAVSNLLDHDCLPFGLVRDAAPADYSQGEIVQEYQFDFFNYSGIHRPVKIYTTPKNYIRDITVTTGMDGASGTVHYNIQTTGEHKPLTVVLLDETGIPVATANQTEGTLVLKNAHFWDVRAAYLYELDIRAGEDHYTLPVGIRTRAVTEKQLLLNGKPIYLKGFGKHEDSDIRGKGLDEALNVRDFELMKWIGANSFRTSHYPYSEELMQMADRQGFLVIDEVPAVGMHFWSEQEVFVPGCVDARTLEHHKQVLTELYQRDKNHPSVIMWSVANEARTRESEALPYFTEVTAHIRSLDPTRPITNVMSEGPDVDTVSHLYDVLCINRYYSWYENTANLASIYPKLTAEFRRWHEKYHKPVMMSEYGADTISGLHKLPEVIFSEEYQAAYYRENNRALDDCDFVVGEHLWAFADFMTAFGLRRVDGNKKGVFTRQRQPKSAAFVIRDRWTNR